MTDIATAPDIGTTIEPKTDQLNADFLIAGPITITVTKVTKVAAKEQPIWINYEGDDGKPYKPGLSMRRALFLIWGRDGASYVGRRMTLFREPSVKFGGDVVGGIRISHMSDIGDQPVTVMLTVTRGQKKPFTVQPLKDAPPKQQKGSTKPIAERVATFLSMLKTVDTEAAVEELWAKAAKLREEVDPETLDRMELAYGGRLDDIRELARQRAEETK
jgi:hypothetical protein